MRANLGWIHTAQCLDLTPLFQNVFLKFLNFLSAFFSFPSVSSVWELESLPVRNESSTADDSEILPTHCLLSVASRE